MQFPARSRRQTLQGQRLTRPRYTDNAFVESFFANLKRKEVVDSVYVTRQEAKLALFTYLEVFYNRERRHSSLGYLSPAEFEQLSRAA